MMTTYPDRPESWFTKHLNKRRWDAWIKLKLNRHVDIKSIGFNKDDIVIKYTENENEEILEFRCSNRTKSGTKMTINGSINEFYKMLEGQNNGRT